MEVLLKREHKWFISKSRTSSPEELQAGDKRNALCYALTVLFDYMGRRERIEEPVGGGHTRRSP
ncbi:hypothetical protein C0Z16_07300 [Paraburkholderia rhynchosiae]|uniref:Uncharacterized protein n=1 Tax=Paraburkholderia rhynchosiae TaxID=487049 RepID=A0ABX4V910_9BURK|nr:hypothetical protein C0Z16_07300 [Paraburkholderia rhynchosiae]